MIILLNKICGVKPQVSKLTTRRCGTIYRFEEIDRSQIFSRG